ncbi:MAG: hypothetical protein GX770_05545 [Firmicutes bacterium]|nr:hypothetical protein [Bacillota bacterium]
MKRASDGGSEAPKAWVKFSSELPTEVRPVTGGRLGRESSAVTSEQPSGRSIFSPWRRDYFYSKRSGTAEAQPFVSQETEGFFFLVVAQEP